MSKVIYYESVAVDWVSQGIAGFFRNIGYTVHCDTVGERNEHNVPLDRIYAFRNACFPAKVFSLQFKAPYKERKSSPTYWRLNHRQNELLRIFKNHIWYALPFFTNTHHYQNALYLTHFIDPITVYQNANRIYWDDYFLYSSSSEKERKELAIKITEYCKTIMAEKYRSRIKLNTGKATKGIIIPYDSWGTLYHKLVGCSVGKEVKDHNDLNAILQELMGASAALLEEKKVSAGITIFINLIDKVVNVVSIVFERGKEINWQLQQTDNEYEGNNQK